MEATLILDTTPLPQDFYDLKLDIYNIVREKTNKTPIARTGWRILKSDKN
jgi:hypothetical protein